MVALAALGAVAGACGQPRSLVQLDVDTQKLAPDDVAHGSLRITVNTEDGLTNIREVSKPIDELRPETGDPSRFQLGVFLPPSVSGKVQVVVVVLDGHGCVIGNSGDPMLHVIVVDAGKASHQEKIAIAIIEPQCPTDGGSTPAPDAGAQTETGGAPPPDAAAETAPAQPDAAVVDTGCPPDAGLEMAPPPTCEDFCALATKDCSNYYGSVDGCMKTCQTWTPGVVPPNDQVGTPGLGDNTIGCRLYFLMHWTPNLKDMFCQAAAPNSSRCTR